MRYTRAMRSLNLESFQVPSRYNREFCEFYITFLPNYIGLASITGSARGIMKIKQTDNTYVIYFNLF